MIENKGFKDFKNEVIKKIEEHFNCCLMQDRFNERVMIRLIKADCTLCLNSIYLENFYASNSQKFCDKKQVEKAATAEILKDIEKKFAEEIFYNRKSEERFI